MALKHSFQRGLKNARRFSEGYLEAFETPEQWTHQVHPGANHALWFVGHMGTIDNFFILTLDATKTRHMPGYKEKFGMNSTPSPSADDYPPVAEVLEYMRERRAMLLSILEQMNDEDFSRPTPEGTPRFLPDMAAVFEGAVWHEGLHSGQLSVARRALGNTPRFR